ncbi:hypothetical protein SmJEL517_g04901 [Synchytrium microbalum]|uniref:E3 ubiquitin-protein ligase CHIP n=1 Tax=Synchytrium microbalum TaxID=1806994 RepID=A0A507BXN2_9FUNG|nr:uncharacterized protein SmJEL517_g04901 [Synchytrium microbalum]TPX31861.1 hypothetical protein SmJEL517_g04901 [Synchytrium microbalum]
MTSTSDEHKKAGNAFFSSQLYDEAIREYSTAIIKNPGIATYYTNRALCYLKMAVYDRVSTDCEKALEIDPKSVKGHYLMGQALTELKRPEATGHLRRAMELGLDQKVAYLEEISTAYRKAKKQAWEVADSKRRLEESDLLKYLTNLVERDRQRMLELSKDDIDEGAEAAREEINTIHNERQSQIASLFAQANENGKERVVPDFALGKISFEVMTDPVISPSGITYDRTEIVSTIRKLGPFDPFTRQTLREADLIPNLAVKEAIEDFLKNNGWAVDF